MLAKRNILILITFFILVGCATKPNIVVMRPDGGPTPDPMYVLRTIDPQRPIQISFYYVATQTTEDLDGSKQPSLSYLERRQEYTFSKDKYPDLHTVLRILNPTNKQYKVFYRMNVVYDDGGQMAAYAEIAHSDMRYREVTCPLPLGKGIKKVHYDVEVVDMDGNILLRTGRFKYNFN